MESFFHSLKVIGFMAINLNRVDLKMAIKHYIEDVYNPIRLHSGIGYLSPMAMEAMVR